MCNSIQQRNMQLEIDKISLQKRQTSEEVAVLEDRKMAVQDSVVELEQNCKHRAEQADRQIAESEKKLKVHMWLTLYLTSILISSLICIRVYVSLSVL